MPLSTTASAVSLMSASLTSHWKRFQLFHPIGGVRARSIHATRAPGAGACTAAAACGPAACSSPAPPGCTAQSAAANATAPARAARRLTVRAPP